MTITPVSMIRNFILLITMMGVMYTSQAQITILSGVKGGSYEQMANDLKKTLFDSLRVLNTKGSVDNFKILANNPTMEVGFVQEDVLVNQQLQDLQFGTNNIQNIRVVLPFVKEEIHLIARNDDAINALVDLQGKRVCVGVENQGTNITAGLIKDILELTWIEIKDTLQFDRMLSDLRTKKIDAFFFVGGAPLSALAKLPENTDVKLIPLNDKRLKELYTRTKIAKGTYKFLTTDIETYAVRSMMVTNVRDESLLHKKNINKLIYAIKEKIGKLQKDGHPKWKEIDFNFDKLDWDTYEGADKTFNAKSDDQKEMVILSGIKGGSYEQFANDLKKVTGPLSVKTSSGSVYNLKQLIYNKDIDATFIQYDVLLDQKMRDEKEGTKYTNDIRILLSLAREDIHIVVRKDSKIKSIKNLNRKWVAVGNYNQGSYVTSSVIKTLLGAKWKDMNLPFESALPALLNEEIDAFVFVGTAPVSKLAEFEANTNLRLIPIVSKKLDGYYSKITIPEGSYKWQKGDIQTYAVKSVLATNIGNETSVKNAHIKKLLEDVKSNLYTLQTQGHPKWKEVDLTYRTVDWEVYSSQLRIMSGIKGGSYERLAHDINRISVDSISILASKGSMENLLKLVSKRDIDATFLQEDVMHYQNQQDYKKGTNNMRYVRVLVPLGNEEIHLITRKDAGIDSLSDLMNKNVAIGAPNQGTYTTASQIKLIAEMNWTDVTNTIQFDTVLIDLKNKKIDAFFFVGASPIKKLTEIGLDENIKLIPLSDYRLKEIYIPSVLPKSLYPFMDKDISTFAVKSVLATNVNAETEMHKKNISKLMEDIRSKLPDLKKNGHPKWKEVDFENLKEMDWEIYKSVETMLEQTIEDKNKITLYSGIKGGSYNAIAQNIKEIAKYPITIENTKGSQDNFNRMIRNGEKNISLGMMQVDVLKKMLKDDASLAENFDIVMPLALEEVHLVARKDGKIQSIKDLKGKKVAIGSMSQGSYITAQIIREVTGVKWEDLEMDFDSAMSNLYNNKIDAFFFVGSSPIAALAKLPEKTNFKLLNIKDPALEEKFGYKPTIIKGNTYKWEKSDIETYSVRSILVAYSGWHNSDQFKYIQQTVVDIKKNMLKLENEGHPKWKEMDFNFDEIRNTIRSESAGKHGFKSLYDGVEGAFQKGDLDDQNQDQNQDKEEDENK